MVNALSERVSKTLVLIACGCSLIEALPELGVSHAYAALFTLLVAKFVVVCTGLAAVAKARFVCETSAFLCDASVLAIALPVPMEFNQSFPIA
jgi:hypothetical protein